MRFRAVSIVVALLVGGMALAQESPPTPLGGEFQINAFTTGSQKSAEVAADEQGDFVVVWYSTGGYGTDTSSSSIQARRFEADGTPKGIDFQVNTYTWVNQDRPEVAVGPLGDFVVVWDSAYSDGDDPSNSIQGQRFDSGGALVESQFEVNSYTSNGQSWPSAALSPQGDFVVAWGSYGSYGADNSRSSVQAQRYDDSGTPDGGQFQVNTFLANWQWSLEVAADGQGDFVVVWQSDGSYGTDTSQRSIQAQRYESDGTPDGGEFQVNSYTSSHQYRPALAVNAQGNFVVVWESYGSYGTDTSRWSIQGQRFDASGTPVGGQFQVNSYTTDDQYKPAVGLDAQGNFIVVWESEGSYGTDTTTLSVQAQFFDACGRPVGGQFQVNSYTTYIQGAPSVSSVDPEGNFVVVWESQGAFNLPAWSDVVQAQRYRATTLFADCFESGDTSRWANTVP